MTDRRDFLRYTGAAAAVSAASVLPACAAQETRLLARPIPGTGELLPVIGLGNTVAFRSGDLDLTRQLLGILLERGGGHVDTSGSGRIVVGQIMREMNAANELFIGSNIEATNDEAAREEIKSVQDAQGGGALDLVLSRDAGDFARRRDQFQKLKDDGLARYVGVARTGKDNFPAFMDLMAADAVDFVQVNYSMLETEAEERLLPLARDRGIGVIISRPFLNGRYFSIIEDQTLPEWAAEFDCNSWAQFSLKFIVAHPAVSCVITETANPSHAVDNLGAGYGRLPDETTRQRMRKLIQSLA